MNKLDGIYNSCMSAKLANERDAALFQSLLYIITSGYQQ
jgi:hypothetical protein